METTKNTHTAIKTSKYSKVKLPMQKKEKALWLALLLTSAFTLIEIAGVWFFDSLALLSDAAHMFTDIAALVIALLAVQIGKRVADVKRTFGYYRFEILAAVFNAVILFLVAIYIFYEAYQRFFTPVTVEPVGMFIIAFFGLIVNFTAMRLLAEGSKDSLNVKGAYLEAWADMLGSAGIIIAATIIYFTHWSSVDSIIAILIGVWVLPRTWTLLKSSINILLEGVPDGIELRAIQTALSNLPQILNVHDLHIWAVTSGKVSLTVHIVTDPKVSNAQAVLQAATSLLAEKFNITHSTIQIESVHCGHDDLQPKV